MKPINGWTKESMIAKIKEHLPEQGRCRDATGACLYHRPSDGARCIVGAFLPGDPENDAWFSLPSSVSGLLRQYPELEKHLPLEVEFMMELQHIHDIGHDSDFVQDRIINWIEDNVE